MRLPIKQIIDILDCTEEYANKVEYQMQCCAFDFSEATNEEFQREVHWAVIDMAQS